MTNTAIFNIDWLTDDWQITVNIFLRVIAHPFLIPTPLFVTFIIGKSHAKAPNYRQ